MSLTESLNRIFHHLQLHRPQLAATLNPGLSCVEIEKYLNGLPFRLPQEIYELYQWHNGTSWATSSCLIPHYWFLPLEAAIEGCKQIERYRTDFGKVSENENAHKPWFPVFFNSEDDYLFVFGDEQQQQHSPVLHCWLVGGDGPRQEYSNLSNFMAIIAEAYSTGTYFFEPSPYSLDHEPYLTQDEPQFAAIRLQVEGDQDLLESLNRLDHKPMTSEILWSTHQQIDRYKDVRAVAPLIRLLNLPFSEVEDPETNASIRRDAAQLLGDIGHPQAVEPLIQVLNTQLNSDRNWMVMGAIVRALRQLEDSRAIAPLQQLINVSPILDLNGTFNQIAENLWPKISPTGNPTKGHQTLFEKVSTLLAYIRFGIAFVFFYTGNCLFLSGYFFMLLFTPKTLVKYEVIQDARKVVKTLQSLNDEKYAAEIPSQVRMNCQEATARSN